MRQSRATHEQVILVATRRRQVNHATREILIGSPQKKKEIRYLTPTTYSTERLQGDNQC